MFSTEFSLTPRETENGIILKLDQVGVIADVFVNGIKVGNVDNLYRVFYLRVPQTVLKEGNNLLEIKIESTIRYTYIKGAEYTSKECCKEYQLVGIWLTPAWVQFARTTAMDLGWDWSVAAAPQGIYGGVSILFDEKLLLEYPIVEQVSPVIRKGKDFVITHSKLTIYANFRVIGKLEEPVTVKAVLTFNGEQIGELEKTIDKLN